MTESAESILVEWKSTCAPCASGAHGHAAHLCPRTQPGSLARCLCPVDDAPVDRPCTLPLDQPSAVHSAMAEFGDLDEHVKRCHRPSEPLVADLRNRLHFAVAARDGVQRENAKLRHDIAKLLSADLRQQLAAANSKFDAHIAAVERFLGEMYATMIDPLAEVEITAKEMCALLLTEAVNQRQRESELHDELAAAMAENNRLGGALDVERRSAAHHMAQAAKAREYAESLLQQKSEARNEVALLREENERLRRNLDEREAEPKCAHPNCGKPRWASAGVQGHDVAFGHMFVEPSAAIPEPVAAEEQPAPIPMVLCDPQCTARHIDEGEFATNAHHTHACQVFGFVWCPAIVAIVGVEFLPGFKIEEQDGELQCRPEQSGEASASSATRGTSVPSVKPDTKGQPRQDEASLPPTTVEEPREEWFAKCRECGLEIVLSAKQAEHVKRNGSVWEFGYHSWSSGLVCAGSLRFEIPQTRFVSVPPINPAPADYPTEAERQHDRRAEECPACPEGCKDPHTFDRFIGTTSDRTTRSTCGIHPWCLHEYRDRAVQKVREAKVRSFADGQADGFKLGEKEALKRFSSSETMEKIRQEVATYSLETAVGANPHKTASDVAYRILAILNEAITSSRYTSAVGQVRGPGAASHGEVEALERGERD